MSLTLKTRKHDGQPVLELIGRVINVDVQKLSKRLETFFKKGFAVIIVDLSQTNFIDSHGLGTLVYYHTLMDKEKRLFVILNTNPDPNAYVARLFELTRLFQVLKVVDAEDKIPPAKKE